MRVIKKKIKDITPYAKNPRKNDTAVAYVAASIREFGFRQPIVLDAAGTIIAGHTRYEAAISLGMDTVPCVIADDLTKEQIRAYRLADNKTAEFATWDADLLLEELSEIGDLDMSEFGFDYGAAGGFYSADDHLRDQDAPEAKPGTTCTCPQCGFSFEV